MLHVGALVTVGLLAGCGGGRGGEGAPCAADEACDEAHVCVLGRCRAECAGYRDCALGSACLLDAEGRGGCRTAAEASCPDDRACPAGTACVEGRCRTRCAETGSCGGVECMSGTCVEPETTRPSCDGERYCPSGICVDEACDEDVAVAAGGLLTCTLRGSGEVDCAGSDAMGALGDGPTEHEGGVSAWLGPMILPDAAIAVGAGWEHACALLADGSVHCAGRGDRGQIGANTHATRPLEALAAEADAEPGRAVAQLALGMHHSCVRRASGQVECFGADEFGQLGDEAVHAPCEGGIACSRTPVVVAGLHDAVRIDAHRGGTCALRADGTVVCWGRAELLGGSSEPTASCVGEEGEPVACRHTPAMVPGLSRITAIAVGALHGCALDEEGVVRCWGANASGQAPAEVALPMAAIDLDAGEAHSCAVLLDESVWCWGASDFSQTGRTGDSAPQRVAGLPRALGVAAGAYHTCARTVDGEIWCWGRDAEGQLADGAPEASGLPPRRALRAAGAP